MALHALECITVNLRLLVIKGTIQTTIVLNWLLELSVITLMLIIIYVILHNLA
jgi:hypothetical protein